MRGNRIDDRRYRICAARVPAVDGRALVKLALSLALWPLRKVGAGLLALLQWILADLRHAVIATLLVSAGWQAWEAGEERAGRIAAETLAKDETARAGRGQTAHRALVVSVNNARRDAREKDAAHAAALARAQEATRERTAREYQAQLADSRLALERLHVRLDAARAAGAAGGGGAADLPDPNAARCRAFGAADCDALFAALPGQLAAAEDNTAKLIGLQDYVRTTLALPWAGEPRTERTDDETDQIPGR